MPDLSKLPEEFAGIVRWATGSWSPRMGTVARLAAYATEQQERIAALEAGLRQFLAVSEAHVAELRAKVKRLMAEELDLFVPGWRTVDRLQAEVERLREAAEAVLPFLPSEVETLNYASLNKGRASDAGTAAALLRGALEETANECG